MGFNYTQIKQRLPQPLLDGYRQAKAVALRGGRHTCPCCGAHLRRFAAGGESPARPAMCPRCLSLERHRWMWLYLENHTRLGHDPLRLLHFAPEYSLAPRLAALPHLHYTTVDLALTPDTAHLLHTRMDITRLALPDAHFDAILCSHVLEHVEDDTAALRELRRVLKPGGWALIAVPVWMDRRTLEDPAITTPADRRRFYEQADHVRLYGCDIVQRLQSAGFHVAIHSSLRLPLKAVDHFGLWRIEQGRVREEILFHCTAVD